MRKIRIISGKAVMYIILLAASVWAIISGLNWPYKAGRFPTIVASVVFILSAIELVFTLLEKEDAEDVDTIDFKLSKDVDTAVANQRTIMTFVWLLGFLFAVILLGLPIAIPLFMFFYLKIESKESWLVSIAITAIFWVSFYFLFIWLLKTQFPAGLLF